MGEAVGKGLGLILGSFFFDNASYNNTFSTLTVTKVKNKMAEHRILYQVIVIEDLKNFNRVSSCLLGEKIAFFIQE